MKKEKLVWSKNGKNLESKNYICEKNKDETFRVLFFDWYEGRYMPLRHPNDTLEKCMEICRNHFDNYVPLSRCNVK